MRESVLTLEVEERAGVGGLLRGSLGDGSQVRAVALQDGRHEAQESLLDLHLQRVQALAAAQLGRVAHAEFQETVWPLLAWGEGGIREWRLVKDVYVSSL